jgi:hypothetical protein
VSQQQQQHQSHLPLLHLLLQLLPRRLQLQQRWQGLKPQPQLQMQ